MNRRTLRAILMTGLVWSVAWAVIGALVGLIEFFRSPPESSYLLALRFLLVGPMAVLGTAGLLGGATFAAVLSRAERGRRLDAIVPGRAAAWGALGGLMFSAAGLGLVAALLGPKELMHRMVPVWTIVAAAGGALSAVGSLAIAKQGSPEVLEEVAALERFRPTGAGGSMNP